ncbi:MAG: 2-oxoglutarate dehydrogenase, E2 component, dihydrolipoamide succinyltransferase [Nocardioidaceae bacterium]
MSVEVVLPALGESVTEGTVTQWLKQVGDDVAVDEPLLEVSTDKVDTEIPSPAAGVLLEIKAAEDETVEVGAVLAVIGDADDGGSADQAGDADQSAAAESEAEQAPAEEAAPEPAEAEAEQAPAEEAAPEPAEAEAEPQPAAEQGSTGEPAATGSSTSVTLPALGESVTEGTVTQWLKQVGDQVAVDEPLLEVSTDKVDTEIPSPVAGTLLEIKVAEDETVEIGAELAIIGEAGAAPSAPAAGEPAQDEQAQAQPQAEEPAQPEPEPDEQAREQPPAAPSPEPAPSPTPAPSPAPAPVPAVSSAVSEAPTGAVAQGGSYVTPLVRKLAARHDVDLASLKGTGVGGRVRKQDVLAAAQAKQAAASEAAAPTPTAAKPAAAAAPTPSPLRGKTEKLSRLRKVIATRMVESLQTSAQLTTVVEVDVTEISRLRDRVKVQFAEREGVKLSFLPFFAKAVVDSLKVYPQLNASINTETDEVTYYDAEHLGVAVDTERGLLVPVIKDAGDLSIAGLARKIADLAARTRDNKITPDELSGGTFTLTNTGSRGALFDTPIINQPQVGILGTGSVVKRPVVIDDPNLGETIAVRHMVYLAMTYDHRLVDGADAARFLTAVKQRLEEANFESELGF